MERVDTITLTVFKVPSAAHSRIKMHIVGSLHFDIELQGSKKSSKQLDY